LLHAIATLWLGCILLALQMVICDGLPPLRQAQTP
jgi:hypothetical protein